MNTIAIHEITAARVYIAGEDEDNYWWEGQPANLEVNREENRVRIGVLTEVGMSESAGIYLSDTEAMRLMAALGAAIHAREGSE